MAAGEEASGMRTKTMIRLLEAIRRRLEQIENWDDLRTGQLPWSIRDLDRVLKALRDEGKA